MFEQLIFDPPFPKEQVIGLGIVLAALAVLGYVRTRRNVGRGKRAALTALRLAVIAGLTVILLRPMLMHNEPVADAKSVFTVLVDTSESMNTCDVDDESRIDVVRAGLKESENGFIRELRQHYDVDFHTFSDRVSATTFGQLTYPGKATGPETDLAGALIGVGNSSSARKKTGVLLVSDGRKNSGADVSGAAAYLKSMNIPVWTTTVGTATDSKDVFVTAHLNQSFLFTGQEGSLKVDVSQTGYTGWSAKVELFRENESMGVQQIIFKGGNERVSFPIREETKGTHEYTVEVEPLHGEADTANNERSVFVQVVDEQAKVLLVEAQPYWDSKFLLRTLQADPNLEVTSIFQMNANKAFAVVQKPTSRGLRTSETYGKVQMPRTKKELFKYDCIILGKDVDTVFRAGDLRLLKAYLEERGGSIVFARGKSYSGRNEILSQLEPVVWDEGGVANARFELTAAGRTSPIFNFGQSKDSSFVLRELPEMLSISKVEKEKSLAVILAKSKSGFPSKEIATISYQRYGKGKVMSIGSTGLWQWAFLPEDLDRYDTVYRRFWGQMIRWLVYDSDFLPGQDISLRTDRLTYNLGETVPLIVQTKFIDPAGYRPRITLTVPDGSVVNIDVEPDPDASGFYSTAYLPKAEGTYEAVLTSDIGEAAKETVKFTVYSDAVERRFVAADTELMGQISRITGGDTLTIEQWRDLPRLVMDFELSAREEMKPYDVWDTMTIFFALVGLLAVEWFVRRRLGLV